MENNTQISTMLQVIYAFIYLYMLGDISGGIEMPNQMHLYGKFTFSSISFKSNHSCQLKFWHSFLKISELNTVFFLKFPKCYSLNAFTRYSFKREKIEITFI